MAEREVIYRTAPDPQDGMRRIIGLYREPTGYRVRIRAFDAATGEPLGKEYGWFVPDDPADGKQAAARSYNAALNLLNDTFGFQQYPDVTVVPFGEDDVDNLVANQRDRANRTDTQQATPPDTKTPDDRVLENKPDQPPPSDAEVNPNDRALQDGPAPQPDGPEGGDPGKMTLGDVRSISDLGQVFGGIGTAGDLARVFEDQRAAADRATQIIKGDLDEWVRDQGSPAAVAGAAAAATVLDLLGGAMSVAEGFGDVFHLGEGAGKGGWQGYGEDAIRLMSVLPEGMLPLGKLGKGLERIGKSLWRRGQAWKNGLARGKWLLRQPYRRPEVRKAQEEFLKRVGEIYKDETKKALRSQGRKAGKSRGARRRQAGIDADAETRKRVQQEFGERYKSMGFEQETGVTRKGYRGGNMKDVDINVPELELSVDLKLSEGATRSDQLMEHYLFSLNHDTDLVYVFGQ